jgi:hypothetical protein
MVCHPNHVASHAPVVADLVAVHALWRAFQRRPVVLGLVRSFLLQLVRERRRGCASGFPCLCDRSRQRMPDVLRRLRHHVLHIWQRKKVLVACA